MAEKQAFDEFLDSRVASDDDAKRYRSIVEQKYKRWLVSVDALTKGRADANSSEPIRRMENAELHDYGMLETGIGLLREAIKARPTGEKQPNGAS